MKWKSSNFVFAYAADADENRLQANNNNKLIDANIGGEEQSLHVASSSGEDELNREIASSNEEDLMSCPSFSATGTNTLK